jgi:AcrR family transcriptional regulator
VNRPIQHKPEKILAAAQSVFADEGVGVSTAKIAAEAGVSNGTLFNYFPTKQALIDALYVSIKSDLAEAVGEFDDAEPIEHRMRQVWDRWFGWASQNGDAHLVVNLLRQAGLASTEAQTAGNAAILGPARVLNEAKESGLLVDLPIEHLAALIQQHLDQAVASQLDDRQAELAFHVLWNGITQQPSNPLAKDSS